MDRFNRKSFTLGEDTFFVQLIPPKESIKAWTEVQKVLLPALSGAMEGMNMVPVTRLMFSAPASCSLRQISENSSMETSLPIPPRLIWWFWQNRHCSVQPVKKMVPLPPFPVIGGSSPWCSVAQAIRMALDSLQNPSFPAVRSTPQTRGQSVHLL